MKNLIKLAYCGMLAFNVMAMEGLEDSTSRRSTSMSIEQVDMALERAVSSNDSVELVFLLSGGAGAIPSQGGVDHAFSWAASMKNRAILTFMVGHPTIRPTENCIIDTYHREVGNRNEAVAILIELEITRLLGSDPGRIMDLDLLERSLLPLDSCVAAFEEIYSSLRGMELRLIPYYSDTEYDARGAIEQAIMSIFDEDKQREIERSVFNRIDANPDYQEQLCAVLTFLAASYADRNQEWIEAFLHSFVSDTGIKKSIIEGLKIVKLV